MASSSFKFAKLKSSAQAYDYLNCIFCNFKVTENTVEIIMNFVDKINKK